MYENEQNKKENIAMETTGTPLSGISPCEHRAHQEKFKIKFELYKQDPNNGHPNNTSDQQTCSSVQNSDHERDQSGY